MNLVSHCILGASGSQPYCANASFNSCTERCSSIALRSQMRLHVHRVRIFSAVVTLYGSVNRSSYIAGRSVLCLPVKISDAMIMQPVKNMANILARYYRRKVSEGPVVVQCCLPSRKSASSSVPLGVLFEDFELHWKWQTWI